uniref:Uncharacterized protein n=1 Tax=Anguilla anguilla TaxID=7936 RepID=A0A0E9QVD2_ANGAN
MIVITLSPGSKQTVRLVVKGTGRSSTLTATRILIEAFPPLTPPPSLLWCRL